VAATLLAALSIAAPVGAQVTPRETPVLPDITAEQRREFQVCRAAIFYHLANRAEHDVVPRAVAQAMLEQMSFVMSETLATAPRGSMEEGRTMLDFAENFFITFSGIIAEHSHFATEVAEREATLLACQPMLWASVGDRIDALMAEREAR
jgi:hypothetical protein